jgi:hypothetical protein
MKNENIDMDRIIEIKRENGLKDNFQVKYLTGKLILLGEEYNSLLNSHSYASPIIHNYLLSLRETIIVTYDLLNEASA